MTSSKEIPLLPTIGAGTLAILRQYSIRSADDIDRYSDLQDIPGIGPAKAAILQEWASANLSPSRVANKKRQDQIKREINAQFVRERASAQHELDARLARRDAASRPLNQILVVGGFLGFARLFFGLKSENEGILLSFLAAGVVSVAAVLLAKAFGELLIDLIFRWL
jgi:hypothetical protein